MSSESSITSIIDLEVAKGLDQAAHYDHVLLDREQASAVCLAVAKAVVEECGCGFCDLRRRLTARIE